MWRNVDVVYEQLLAIRHRNQNTLLLQMRIGLLRKSGHVVKKGIVSLISISRPQPMFLWWSSHTAVNSGDFSGLVLLVSLVSRIAAMLILLQWRKVCSSVIFLLIPFVFHCISYRQLVGVGAKSGPGFTLKQKCRHRMIRHHKCYLTSR